MSRKHSILMTTGAALSLSGIAVAQSADLDIDRAYAAELKADASRHASLLQAGGSGYDGAFHIGDASGNNRLNINGHLGFRYIANFGDDDGSVSEDFTHGFEQKFANLSFNGNVINPQITFNISMALGQDNSDEELPNILRDAWVQYNFEGEGSGFYARWGQFKAPLLNEENIHDGKQLAVNRGPVNEIFSPSWSEGVMLGYTADAFAIHGYWNDGIRTPSATMGTTAGTPYSGADSDFALGARADIKFSGAWEQFDDFTSFRGSDNALKIGGGIHFQDGGDTGAIGGATADAEYWLWTIDAQWESNGWNLAAGYIGSSVDEEGGADYTNQGFYLQGGVFLADQWELFGRWDWLDLDDEFLASGDSDDFHFLTVGANYYFVPESHALKFTGDVIWAIDEAPVAAGGQTSNFGDTGLIGSTDNDEFAIRLQVSLLF